MPSAPKGRSVRRAYSPASLSGAVAGLPLDSRPAESRKVTRQEYVPVRPGRGAGVGGATAMALAAALGAGRGSWRIALRDPTWMSPLLPTSDVIVVPSSRSTPSRPQTPKNGVSPARGE